MTAIPSTLPASPAHFHTTRWSLVLAARGGMAPDSHTALDALCRAYWYPLYAFVRRLGHRPHDAQDLTQEFFARLLEKKWLDAAEQEKGRFRTFLIVALKRFLANEWDRSQCARRGGGATILPLESALAEARYTEEPGATESADALYERRWALTLLDKTVAALRAEYEARTADFDVLKEFLTVGRGEIPYAEVATRLGTSEATARVAVHRLRKRFRELFRATIADTVTEPAEVETELRYVVEILGRG